MNPEAVQWLEGLDVNDRLGLFRPVYTPELYSVKEDHERCLFCRSAETRGTLLVIE